MSARKKNVWAISDPCNELIFYHRISEIGFYFDCWRSPFERTSNIMVAQCIINYAQCIINDAQ